MKEIVRFFRKLLRLEKDIAKIVSPMGKILRELDDYVTAQANDAIKAHTKANDLKTAAAQAEAKAGEAEALKAKYRELTVV